MHRIDGPAAAPGNLFTEGDPNAGTPATVVTDDWLNAVQEELVGVISVGAGLALSKPDNLQLLKAIKKLIDAASPIGIVAPFAMGAVPAGWLECNGQAVSRTAYPTLFTAIGTSYGVGDGSSTFNVPELRGEFIRGWDHGRGVDVGRALGSAQGMMIESHTHALAEIATTGAFAESGDASGGSTASSATTLATGGVETRPRNVALMLCIRAA